MNWAYQQKTGRSTAKSVLVALANQADQNGKCWPSIDYLMNRTEIGRRAVIGNLAFLEEKGLIERVVRGGTGSGRKSNVYTLKMQSAADAPSPPKVQQMHKGQCADNDTKKGGNVHIKQGQSAADAPKQSKNNQLKKNNQKTIGEQKPVIEVPDFINGDLLLDWIQHRKEMKKPLTPTAEKRLVSKLTTLRDQGHDPNACIEHSIANGYQGIFPPGKSGKSDSTTGNDTFWRSIQ